MGRLVDFASLAGRPIAPGVTCAAISDASATRLQAELLRLDPHASLSARVPAGSDRYLYLLRGSASLSANDTTYAIGQDTFATLQEGTDFVLANPGSAAIELVSVTAPPHGARIGDGYAGGVCVTPRASAPVRDVPEQKKRRLYFVSESAAQSARAHAMIVEYQADTVTAMHAHPDADSLFVPLTGKVRFAFDGAEHVLGRGGATVFPAGDRHELRVAEGKVSFLEFHVPAGYTTVR